MAHERRGGFRGLRLLPIGIALAVVLFQFLTAEKYKNPETGRSARVGLSEKQEEALGLQSYRQVLAQSKVVESGPQVEMVRRVAQRLIDAIGDTGNQWALSVVDDPTPNAFVLPGGKIVVYTGLLKIAGNEAQIAAVLGHELAHEIARHAGQRVLQQQMVQTAMLGAQASMANMDWEQQRTLMGILGAGAQYGYILPFSREHESEADFMGLKYMARAGYDPQEALQFWKRMAAQGGERAAEFASTHPSNETRIRDLERHMPEALEEFRKARQKSGLAAVE